MVSPRGTQVPFIFVKITWILYFHPWFMDKAPAQLETTEAWLCPLPEGLTCSWEVVRECGTAGTDIGYGVVTCQSHHFPDTIQY